ncbi:tetratricopeptide repeat protein [Paenibacillus sp. J2TS4]|uniref:tetratricopeptide repeat protein n=1 Tax=Paenibacillus sp. J2TS4 TaxID=2807194 RepID=UPI001B02835C|nr:tetratricopeptide repeat protein [Paenibacillus sp. J2TS4]GIP35921.1 hypothetical protein J2TS4_51310 [Paenibacillus sp. J2TS4]
MSSIGTTVSGIIRGGMTLWNRIKNPQTETIKLVIKSLKKGAEQYRDYLTTKVEQDDLSESVYWEERELRKFFEKKYAENKLFGFHTCDAKELAQEIERYFILSNHHLTDYEKISLVEKVILNSQKYYILTQTNDNKSMEFLQLRGDIKMEQILQVISLLPSMQKDIEIIKQKVTVSEQSKAEVVEVVKDFSYYCNLCVQLYEERNYSLCLATIHETLRTHLTTEQYISLLFLESGIYYNQFNYDLALECIFKIEDKVTDDISDAFTASILGQKGSIYSEKGAKEGNRALVRLGIDCFEQQLSIHTLNDSKDNTIGLIYYNLGTSYLSIIDSQSDINSCIEYFELAFEMLPDNAEIMKNLGTAYGIAHQHEKEIEMYQKALEANPELFETLCAMGMVYYRYYQDPEEASKYYQRAVRSREEIIRFPYAYYWLGKCYFEVGHKEKAKTAIEEGLRIAPTLEPLIELKIDVLYALLQEKHDKYLPEFIQYINKLYPTPTEESSSKLLSAMILNSKYDNARDLLSTLPESIKESEMLIPSYFIWAFNLMDFNDFEGAYQVINNINPEKITEEIKSFKYVYHYITALCLSGLQRHEEAIYHLESIHGEGSIFQAVDSHCMLGDAYLKIEEYDKARVHFQKAKSIVGEVNTNMDIEYGLFQAYLGLERVRPAKVSFMKIVDLITFPYVSNVIKNEKDKNFESAVDKRISEMIVSMYRLALLEVRLKIADDTATIQPDRKEIMKHLDPLLQYFSKKVTRTVFNFDKFAMDYLLAQIGEKQSNDRKA